MKRIATCCLAIALVLQFASPVFGSSDIEEVIAAGDLVICRPLGFVSTLLGAGLFVLSLPFAIPSASVNETAETFVGKPLSFTFQRPLGDFGMRKYEKPMEVGRKKEAGLPMPSEGNREGSGAEMPGNP